MLHNSSIVYSIENTITDVMCLKKKNPILSLFNISLIMMDFSYEYESFYFLFLFLENRLFS